MIELLIKSSNREELPKKIKFEEDIFELNDESKTYKAENGNFLTDSINFNLSNLNDEVKIIEDEEKINIQEIELAGLKSFVDADGKIDNVNLAYKYNELLLAVKQLDKRINKE